MSKTIHSTHHIQLATHGRSIHKGHITRVIGNEPRVTLAIPVAE